MKLPTEQCYMSSSTFKQPKTKKYLLKHDYIPIKWHWTNLFVLPFYKCLFWSLCGQL